MGWADIKMRMGIYAEAVDAKKQKAIVNAALKLDEF